MSRVPNPVFKDPELNQPTFFAFPPNRNSLGGTAYLILENTGNVLVDCPVWNEVNYDWMMSQGGVHSLCITHRSAIAQVKIWQHKLNCQVIIQEQEAYLLPDVDLTTFHDEFTPTPKTTLIWTPGHSPGSACLYHQQGTLFTGRHLLPSPSGILMAIQNRNTFHWPRQVRSVRLLCDRFTPETLQYICPGANLGFLRGQHFLDNAHQRIQDWLVSTSSSPTFASL